MIGILLACIYTVEDLNSKTMIAYLTLLTIYLTGQLIYVRYERQSELCYSLYASAFIFLVTWIFVVNYKQYIEIAEHGVWTPCNAITLVVLYALVLYAVIRSDDRRHFYYFHWILCSGGVVERSLNHSKYKLRNTERSINLNETMITCVSERNEIEKEGATDSNVVYNESFMHIFLCLISLKSTAVVTNYTVLVEQNDQLKADKTLSPIIALFVSSLLVNILFAGYLVRSGMDSLRNDPRSVGQLLKSIIHCVIHYTFRFLFGKPKCLTRTSLSRFVYYIFYVLCFVLACFVVSPSSKHYFQKSSLFCDHVTVFGACMSQDPTFTSLYRIFGTIATFFMVVALMTSSVNLSSRLRNSIQNGCWPIKLLLISAIFVSVLNLPNRFSRYWLYFDLVSILAFTLLQLFCLIDAISIVTTSYKRDTKSGISAGSSSITCLLYAISIIAYVSFYVYYAHNYQCSVMRFFVSINLVLCLSASVISLHPVVKTGNLLLSAVVTSLCMYSTWSALNYNPEEECNPLGHTLMIVEASPGRDVVSVVDLFFLFVSLTYFIARVEHVSSRAYDLCFHLLVESFVISSRQEEEDEIDHAEQQTDVNEKVRQWLSECNEEVTANNIKSVTNNAASSCDSEDDKNTGYFSIHFIHSMACSYAFLLLAHWLEPVPGSGFKVSLHWAMMSVKLITSSIGVLVYIWILVVPVVVEKVKSQRNQ